MIFIHSFQLLFRECNYPKGFMWWIGFHAVLFWFLFMDFYKNTYLTKKQKVKSSSSTPFFACSQTEKLINGFTKNVSNDLLKVGKKQDSLNEKPQSVRNGVLNGLSFNHQDKGSKEF